MLKHLNVHYCDEIIRQPPSGGCVLKPAGSDDISRKLAPAAFRRLCVETRTVVSGSVSEITSRLQAAVC